MHEKPALGADQFGGSGSERQIEQYGEGLVETTMPAVVRALERKMRALENHRLLIEERVATAATPAVDFGKRFGTALEFLAHPWNRWSVGGLEDRRAVLRRTFAEKLRYKRGDGFRTANLSLPFEVSSDFCPVI